MGASLCYSHPLLLHDHRQSSFRGNVHHLQSVRSCWWNNEMKYLHEWPMILPLAVMLLSEHPRLAKHVQNLPTLMLAWLSLIASCLRRKAAGYSSVSGLCYDASDEYGSIPPFPGRSINNGASSQGWKDSCIMKGTSGNSRPCFCLRCNSVVSDNNPFDSMIPLNARNIPVGIIVCLLDDCADTGKD